MILNRVAQIIKRFGGWLQQTDVQTVEIQVGIIIMGYILYIIMLMEFDCSDPEWSSVNLGIFICLECSGVHRSFGTHISQVKSVRLDHWTDAQTKVRDIIKNGIGSLKYILTCKLFSL